MRGSGEGREVGIRITDGVPLGYCLKVDYVTVIEIEENLCV